MCTPCFGNVIDFEWIDWSMLTVEMRWLKEMLSVGLLIAAFKQYNTCV
jgi:hypothetical protein